MFRPQIEKTSVLLLLTLFSMSMAYYASSQIIYDKQLGYEEKVQSTKIMEKALSILQKEVKWKNEKGEGYTTKNSLSARDFLGGKDKMQDSYKVTLKQDWTWNNKK